jgi:hypothetical protein
MIGWRLGLCLGFEGVVFVENICCSLAAVDALALYHRILLVIFLHCLDVL